MENEKEEVVESIQSIQPLEPTFVEEPKEVGLDVKIRRTESVYPMEKEIEYEMKCDFDCPGCNLLTKFLGL